MDKQELVRIFNEIGLLLELKGENPFKTRAYYNAARILENLTEDLDNLIAEDRVREISGFGDAIVNKISEWSRTGRIEYYDTLKNTVPPGLYELLKIPGLGPKRINQIHQSLGISNLEMLEQVCSEHRLAALPGFGPKTEAKILAGIGFVKEHRGNFLRMEIFPVAVDLCNEMGRHPQVLRAELAGSIRRCKEVVKDIDLVVATEEPQAVIDYFINLPRVVQVIGSGATKGSVILKNGINADLRAVHPREFPHTLQHFTGSKEHNTELRHLAKELGYKVNEYALFRGEESIYCESETEIYQNLGLSFIPPELREGYGEINAAQNHKLPDLIQLRDLKGVFHVHTNYSDGVNSLREMVEAAVERGYHYLGISDHSRVAVYAHGLSETTVLKQFEEIDELNREYPDFKIFKGIEADILPDGELDYSPDKDFLWKFDFIIGSVHSQFQMSKDEMTRRILKAIENPFLTILGHATGRILLERPGYELDLDLIIQKAVQNGVILEFNANPYRLDLDWRLCRKVKELGGQVAINPDAHSVTEFDLMPGGLETVRKGWLEAGDVFNTKSAGEIQQFLAKRKIVKR